jgi:hypothetical protein
MYTSSFLFERLWGAKNSRLGQVSLDTFLTATWYKSPKIPRKTRGCICLNGSFLQEMGKYESWRPNAGRKAIKYEENP